MVAETFYTMSNADELLLEVLAAEPDPDIPKKGIIQIVHGKSEHKERYLPFIRYMTSAGYVCIIHDLRGHGNSVRNEEDLGYMYGIGVEGFLSDIHQITRMAIKRWPGLKLILFGHGMGSLAVRCAAREWEEDVSCMILSGPHSRNRMVASGLLITKLKGLQQKSKMQSSIMKHLTLAPFDKRFPGESADFHWLCSDPETIEEYNRDPLCGFDLAADGYEVYLRLMKMTYHRTKWRTEKPDMPVLFIGGADDPYIGGPAPFHQAIRSMRNLGYSNVKGKLYPGLRHEILNEVNREMIFNDLVKYLQRALDNQENTIEQ